MLSGLLKVDASIWVIYEILKKYVRNQNRLENCIVECYTYEEVVEFCNEYLSNVEPIGLPKRVCTKRINDNDKIGFSLIIINHDL